VHQCSRNSRPPPGTALSSPTRRIIFHIEAELLVTTGLPSLFSRDSMMSSVPKFVQLMKIACPSGRSTIEYCPNLRGGVDFPVIRLTRIRTNCSLSVALS